MGIRARDDGDVGVRPTKGRREQLAKIGEFSNPMGIRARGDGDAGDEAAPKRLGVSPFEAWRPKGGKKTRKKRKIKIHKFTKNKNKNKKNNENKNQTKNKKYKKGKVIKKPKKTKRKY